MGPARRVRARGRPRLRRGSSGASLGACGSTAPWASATALGSVRGSSRHRPMGRRAPQRRRGARDAHDLLLLLPDAKLRGIDEAVDDVRVVLDPVVDELRLACRAARRAPAPRAAPWPEGSGRRCAGRRRRPARGVQAGCALDDLNRVVEVERVDADDGRRRPSARLASSDGLRLASARARLPGSARRRPPCTCRRSCEARASSSAGRY